MLATRQAGSITEWNDERGFGFITPDSGGSRVFVHVSAFPRTRSRPFVGERVEFHVEQAPDGRMRAAEVTSERVVRIQRSRRRGRLEPVALAVVAGFTGIFIVAVTRWDLPDWVSWLYASTSILSVIAYANDKRAARTGGWRERENTLLILGLIGGWPGAVLAQQFLRHKTVKAGFRAQFQLTVIANLIAFVVFAYPGLADGVALLIGGVG